MVFLLWQREAKVEVKGWSQNFKCNTQQRKSILYLARIRNKVLKHFIYSWSENISAVDS